MSKPRGLPSDVRMRHDVHFVDQLAGEPSPAVGRMIGVADLAPNPQQPRRELGDLTDLVASIKEKGILEPILVRKQGTGYQIIAGERRYHAAKAAGLTQVPCVELEVDERGVLEISLIENLQRRDLDPFEEADAIRQLCEKFAYTHEKVAQKLGKSRSSVTEMLGIATIPEVLREACRRADISSKSLLVEIARQPTTEMMEELVERVAHEKMTRDDARRLRAVPPPPEETGAEGQGRQARPGQVFRFRIEAIPASVQLRVAHSHAGKQEILAALRDLIRQIEASDDFRD